MVNDIILHYCICAVYDELISVVFGLYCCSSMSFIFILSLWGFKFLLLKHKDENTEQLAPS